MDGAEPSNNRILLGRNIKLKAPVIQQAGVPEGKGTKVVLT